MYTRMLLFAISVCVLFSVNENVESASLMLKRSRFREDPEIYMNTVSDLGAYTMRFNHEH